MTTAFEIIRAAAVDAQFTLYEHDWGYRVYSGMDHLLTVFRGIRTVAMAVDDYDDEYRVSTKEALSLIARVAHLNAQARSLWTTNKQ